MPLIQLDDVTLRLGDTPLFPHTSWALEPGQHWAFFGPNGSGKSLLANALCRQVPLAAGQIRYRFDGMDRSRSYLERGEIVHIGPDDHAALTAGSYHQARWNSIEGEDGPTVADRLTGESIEHVSAYQVGPTRTPAEVYRRRRDRAVSLLGMRHLLDRRVLHLSNGEGRKLLIARALMQSPHLLILDDPFGGLDAVSRRTLRRAIDQLLSAFRPQLLVLTSRVEEVPGKITHILRVDRCRIVDCGERNGIISSPYPTPAESPSRAEFPPASTVESPLPDPLVAMRDVSVRYGDTRILDRIDWTVCSGERWALMGPNGAGKSTLLSLILADNPQAYVNDIRLFGRRRGSGESIWEVKRRIGWLSPELQRHHPSATPCFNVVCSGFFDSVGLYHDYTTGQKERTLEWLRAFELEPLANRPFAGLSAGEQRLALLARALVKEPLLLVLDEPCQGLDGPHTDRIVDLLDQLCARRPIGLIYVTHRPDELPRTTTHLLELDRGRAQRCGSFTAV